jgi:hypothetical protein
MPGPKRSRREHTDEWASIKQWTLWPEQTLYEEIRPIILFGRKPSHHSVKHIATSGTPPPLQARRYPPWHQINSQTDWRDGLEPPFEHHVSPLMVVRLASLVHGREAPHLSISRSMVGFTLVGMSLAACAERETKIR